MENFKRSEEYATSQNNQYDAGYDKGVQEIFFNIWRKRREVNYRFLWEEFKKIMATWSAREKNGEFNIRPPPSPQYFDEDKAAEEDPAHKAPDQAPSA